MQPGMNEPMISIIVPVYNVEKYLDKCMSTLLEQTYENNEIVLVDDGSTDNSGKLCDEYASKYSNVSVVHKANAGLGYARNSGLDVISGDYVIFVDSDDWVSADYVKHLYTELSKNGVDMCKGGFKRVTHEGETISVTQYEVRTYKGSKARLELLPRMIGSSPDAHDSLEMSACSTLYNASIIREFNIRFPSERELISEDLVFNIDFMQHAEGACTIDALDYFYRANEVSLTHRYRPDRMKASAHFCEVIRKKLTDLGYGEDTMLRLDRCFFIYVRMSISQEQKGVAPHDKAQSIANIKKICENETVQKVIEEYPVERLGVKQSTFLKLVYKKHSRLLYMLANAGMM